HRAVAVVDDRAVGALGDRDHGQGLILVGRAAVVVGRHVGGDGRVLVGRGAVGRRHGIIVDTGDGDAHRGRSRGAVAVGDGVGVAVAAEVVGGRRVGHRAVAVVDDRAVGALGDRDHGQELIVVGGAA